MWSRWSSTRSVPLCIYARACVKWCMREYLRVLCVCMQSTEEFKDGIAFIRKCKAPRECIYLILLDMLLKNLRRVFTIRSLSRAMNKLGMMSILVSCLTFFYVKNRLPESLRYGLTMGCRVWCKACRQPPSFLSTPRLRTRNSKSCVWRTKKYLCKVPLWNMRGTFQRRRGGGWRVRGVWLKCQGL